MYLQSIHFNLIVVMYLFISRAMKISYIFQFPPCTFWAKMHFKRKNHYKQRKFLKGFFSVGKMGGFKITGYRRKIVY